MDLGSEVKERQQRIVLRHPDVVDDGRGSSLEVAPNEAWRPALQLLF